MDKPVKTRKQYLAKECTHREYYGQFVTPGLINHVILMSGRTRLLKSTDEHLNDIPLQVWDSMVWIKDYIDRNLLRATTNWKDPKTYPWSLSDQVCIAKEAAKQFIEREQTNAPKLDSDPG